MRVSNQHAKGGSEGRGSPRPVGSDTYKASYNESESANRRGLEMWREKVSGGASIMREFLLSVLTALTRAQ
jgi:hypothetical protein